MSEITTVGLDLAKNVFQLRGADGAGRAVLGKKLRRDQVLGVCQTNANSSQNPLPRPASGSKKAAPLDQSSGTIGFEVFSGVERAFLIEVVV